MRSPESASKLFRSSATHRDSSVTSLATSFLRRRRSACERPRQIPHPLSLLADRASRRARAGPRHSPPGGGCRSRADSRPRATRGGDRPQRGVGLARRRGGARSDGGAANRRSHPGRDLAPVRRAGGRCPSFYLLQPTVFAFLSHLHRSGEIRHEVHEGQSLWTRS